jgi:hypothetical protein
VALSPDISETAGGNDHTQKLLNSLSCRRVGERENILPSGEGVVGRQRSDVGGVIQGTVFLDRDVAAPVLTQALKTAPAWRGDVGSPARHPQCAICLALDVDTRIDDWDEMSHSDVIERGPGPWSIDTAE